MCAPNMMAEPRRARIALVRGLDILEGHRAGPSPEAQAPGSSDTPSSSFGYASSQGGDGFHVVVGAEWTTAAPKEIAHEGRPSRRYGYW